MFYQRLDEPNLPVQQLQLQDLGTGNGAYAGVFRKGSLRAQKIQFIFEVTDLNDQVAQFQMSRIWIPSEAATHSSLECAGAPAIELSETVPYNFSTLTDETGGSPDWVELRNIPPLRFH